MRRQTNTEELEFQRTLTDKSAGHESQVSNRFAKTVSYKREYRCKPTRRTSKSLSATLRVRFRVCSAWLASCSTMIAALAYSSSLKSLTSAPTSSRVTSASESPMPALMTKGTPHPRYSAYFVGDEANLEKQGLMNANPASLAERYDGTSEGAAAINP